MSRAKHERIVRTIREKILRGQLDPRTRLPTREQLGRRFGASRATVQKAFDALGREGLIYSRTRVGTFVAERPRLTRIGIVFPRRPSPGQPWPRFWVALHQAALGLHGQDGVELFVYCSGEARPDSEDYGQLLRDVEGRRLGGLIFANQPGDVLGTPLLEQPDLPRVAVMAQPLVPELPVVFPDVGGLIDRALDHLIDRGRRCVAFLTPGHLPEHVAHIGAAVRRRRLVCRESWLQVVQPGLPGSARGVAHLLMDRPAAERPDALVITDDNLVDDAAAGLVAAGVRLDRDLSVVAHCNYPLPGGNTLPATRLGFDCYAILRRGIAIIKARRSRRAVPPRSLIAPLFEHEVVPVFNGRTAATEHFSGFASTPVA